MPVKYKTSIYILRRIQDIHVWNVYIFKNKLYGSFLALYNDYTVKIN
jgi:hypothetical protein